VHIQGDIEVFLGGRGVILVKVDLTAEGARIGVQRITIQDVSEVGERLREIAAGDRVARCLDWGSQIGGFFNAMVRGFGRPLHPDGDVADTTEHDRKQCHLPQRVQRYAPSVLIHCGQQGRTDWGEGNGVIRFTRIPPLSAFHSLSIWAKNLLMGGPMPMIMDPGRAPMALESAPDVR